MAGEHLWCWANWSPEFCHSFAFASRSSVFTLWQAMNTALQPPFPLYNQLSPLLCYEPNILIYLYKSIVNWSYHVVQDTICWDKNFPVFLLIATTRNPEAYWPLEIELPFFDDLSDRAKWPAKHSSPCSLCSHQKYMMYSKAFKLESQLLLHVACNQVISLTRSLGYNK